MSAGGTRLSTPPASKSVHDRSFLLEYIIYIIYTQKYYDMRPEPGFPFQAFGLLWALALTIALAILCRFLPGGRSGDGM